jgi:1,2-diacylglycerol 3-alpha-glucosyltransferase
MRIAYVCPSYPPHVGGVETHVSQIASRIAAAGNHVEVLTLTDGPAPVIEELSGVVVRRHPGALLRGRFAVPWRQWRYASAHHDDWDVLHAHDYSSPTGVAAALAGTTPFVFTPHFHGRGHSAASRARHFAYRPAAAFVFARATRVICVSRAESDLLIDHYPSLADRVIVIPNGTSRLRSQPPAEDRRPLVLSMGRLEAYKGVDTIIGAIGHLPPEITLEVIGDGPARASLAELAASEGVTARVTFLGAVDESRVDSALDEGRVLVTMSSHEAFGLAPLDALARGLPVVASDIPAHRELSEQYGNGRMTLVPIGVSPEALAEAIERAAASGVRNPPPDLPTWESVAMATLDLYRRLVSADRAGD